MNIVVPMAGRGQRFVDAGYTIPKPFIDVNGKMMIERVIDSVYVPNAQYIFLVLKDHIQVYPESIERLKQIVPNAQIIVVDKITEGAACTALLAKEHIDNEQQMILMNSDQFIDFDQERFSSIMNNQSVDGAILTFTATDPKWSFVTIANNQVTWVAEKEPISNHATVGLYYWKQGKDFVESANTMISRNERVKNEFYVAPTFNYMIKKGAKIVPFDIISMIGVGTPEDLKLYLAQSGNNA